VNDSLTLLSENDSSLLEIQTKFEFRFDAIKNVAGGTVGPKALSADNADSTL
jgi:hypothetical protein